MKYLIASLLLIFSFSANAQMSEYDYDIIEKWFKKYSGESGGPRGYRAEVVRSGQVLGSNLTLHNIYVRDSVLIGSVCLISANDMLRSFKNADVFVIPSADSPQKVWRNYYLRLKRSSDIQKTAIVLLMSSELMGVDENIIRGLNH